MKEDELYKLLTSLKTENPHTFLIWINDNVKYIEYGYEGIYGSELEWK